MPTSERNEEEKKKQIHFSFAVQLFRFSSALNHRKFHKSVDRKLIHRDKKTRMQYFSFDFLRFLIALNCLLVILKNFTLSSFAMMAQSSGYFSTVRTQMNFHWFDVSFVKNLLCECGTQTHRHTYACTRAKKLWANERKQREGAYWLIFWSPAVFVMYRLALVVDKAKATVFDARFDRQSQQMQYTARFTRADQLDPLLHSIRIRAFDRLVFAWAKEHRTKASLVSVARFIDTISFGCAYAMNYTRTLFLFWLRWNALS